MTQDEKAWAVVQGLGDPDLVAHIRRFTEVAAALKAGAPWRVKTIERISESVRMQNEDGANFYISHAKSRLWVHCGIWAENCKGETKSPFGYGETAPTISVSNLKTPAQIAGDIERRFLPEYLAAWDKSKAEAHSSSEFYNLVDDRVDMLKRGTKSCNPKSAPASTRMNGHVQYPYRNTGGYVNTCEVHSDDVSMSLRGVSLEVAIEIINLVYGK